MWASSGFRKSLERQIDMAPGRLWAVAGPTAQRPAKSSRLPQSDKFKEKQLPASPILPHQSPARHHHSPPRLTQAPKTGNIVVSPLELEESDQRRVRVEAQAALGLIGATHDMFYDASRHAAAHIRGQKFPGTVLYGSSPTAGDTRLPKHRKNGQRFSPDLCDRELQFELLTFRSAPCVQAPERLR